MDRIDDADDGARHADHTEQEEPHLSRVDTLMNLVNRFKDEHKDKDKDKHKDNDKDEHKDKHEILEMNAKGWGRNN